MDGIEQEGNAQPPLQGSMDFPLQIVESSAVEVDDGRKRGKCFPWIFFVTEKGVRKSLFCLVVLSKYGE